MRKAKIDQLLAELQALPEIPVGSHLTDAEYVAFVLEEMTSEQEARIDAHLATCPQCTQDLDAFFAAAETFPQAEWETQRLAFVRHLRARMQEEGLAQRLLSRPHASPASVSYPGGVLPGTSIKGRLRAFLASMSYSVAFAPQFATATEPWDQESEDGLVGIFVEDVKGDMTVHIDAQATELAGVTVRFYAGTWQRDVRLDLDKVTNDQVGAKVVITRDERMALPKDAMLHARLVEDA